MKLFANDVEDNKVSNFHNIYKIQNFIDYLY